MQAVDAEQTAAVDTLIGIVTGPEFQRALEALCVTATVADIAGGNDKQFSRNSESFLSSGQYMR